MGGLIRQSIIFAFSPAILNPHTSALNIAGVVQALVERVHTIRPRVRRFATEKSDDRHRGFLRTCSDRPHGRTASQCNEIPPPHSITSSARRRTTSGTCKSSALAVLRLSTVSYFVGACTGRSAGFSPLRIRST